MVLSRGEHDVFIFILFLSDSQTFFSYLEPRLEYTVHQAMPSQALCWGSQWQSRELAGNKMQLFLFLNWGDTEIMIPALRNLSLSILYTNKAGSDIVPGSR